MGQSPGRLLEYSISKKKQHFGFQKMTGGGEVYSSAAEMYSCREGFLNIKYKSDLQGILCGAWSAVHEARKEN